MGMDRKIEKKKWPIWKIGTYIGLGTLVIVLLSNIYAKSGVSRLNVASERLLTDTIHTDVFKEYITIFGRVEPLKTVYIDALESGKIEEIFIEDGTMISAGTPILRLSNTDLQLNVLNQEARIVDQINTIRSQSILLEQQSLTRKEIALDIEYQIDLLGKRTERNRQLFKDGALSNVDFEETQDEYEHLLRRRKLLAQTISKDSLYEVMQQNQMETSLDLMKRNLDFAKASLDNLIVRSPITGQLSSFDAEIGELINRGDRIAQLDIVDNFKVVATIDEFYISRIFAQQEGTLTLDGKTYKLQIKKIYPEVTNRNFEVDLVFVDEAPTNIKRGQSLSLKLSLSDETQARLLAKGGFFQSTGGNWVFVVDPKGQVARRRDVRLGRQNPNYYEVLEGLNDGDLVIVSSYDSYEEKDELVLKQ
ncbi:MAG: efflux RND transporter periplasmic adaptor subunit [Saprospiraceae bacterium]